MYLNDIENLELYTKLFIYADDICSFYPFMHAAAVQAYIERDAPLIGNFTKIKKLVINPNKKQIIRFQPHSPSNNVFSDL